MGNMKVKRGMPGVEVFMLAFMVMKKGVMGKEEMEVSDKTKQV